MKELGPRAWTPRRWLPVALGLQAGLFWLLGAPPWAPAWQEAVQIGDPAWEQVPSDAAPLRLDPPVAARQRLGPAAPEAEPIVPTAAAPRQRSVQLEMIARQADAHTRRAFELAGRRACFSARGEFIAALRLVALGLDEEHRTREHGAALARGLTALREAEDFIPAGSRLEAELDLGAAVAGHATPVLKDARLDRLTPLGALERYFTYAQEQLAVAAGREVAGAMALHGLGKLHAALADQAALGVKAAEPKAMVFYQAALLADPRNYMAANDLGVLLARAGHYAEARTALMHSLSVQGHAAGWRNLAVVCRQLGQYDAALDAATRWQALARAEAARHGGAATGDGVRWVAPEAFAQAARDAPGAGPAPGAGESPGGSRPALAPRPASRRAWYFHDTADPTDVRNR